MTTTASANTFDWDVVFAARASDINHAIASRKMYPQTADYTDATSGDGFKADIASWQITPGGDSHHVLFNIEFKHCGFSGPTFTPGLKLPDDIVVQVKFALAFIKADGDTHHLKVKPPAGNPGQDHAITVTFTRQEVVKWKLPITKRLKLKDLISNWLQHNQQDFDHVFAMIDVVDAGASGDFAWLKATSIDYAYSPNAQGDNNLDNSVLGVLAMTCDHSPGNNAVQVSPAVIPPGSAAGCVIDPGLYLSEAIIKHLPQMFANSSINNFNYIADKKLIQLVNAVDMDDVPSSDGTPSPCQLTGLELQIVSDEIRLIWNTRVLVKQTDTVVTSLGGYGQPGQTQEVQKNVCYACASQTLFYKLEAGAYDASKKVQGIDFKLSRSSPAQPKTWVEPPPEDPNKIIDEVYNILTLAAVIGSAVLDPVLGVAYALAFSGSNIVKAVEQDDTKLANFKKAPYIESGAVGDAMAMKWGGYDEFELTSIYLNDGIQFGGGIFKKTQSPGANH